MPTPKKRGFRLLHRPPAMFAVAFARRGGQYFLRPRTSRHASGKMWVMRFLLLPFLLYLLSGPTRAVESLADVVERFVFLQTQALPGKVSVVINPLPPSSRLQECTKLEAFLPTGARLWGKSNVGIRCTQPQIWSQFVPVTVRVSGDYVATTRPVAAGQVISPEDITIVSGDLTSQPHGIVNDPKGVVGKTSKVALQVGQSLRADQLLMPLVIRTGQTVRIISAGPGFAVSSEGKALGNAMTGQVVQIRLSSGQVVSGVARQDGNAEISF